MPGPWEAYQQPAAGAVQDDGPWTAYQGATPKVEQPASPGERPGFVQTTKNEFSEGVDSVTGGWDALVRTAQEPYRPSGGVRLAKGFGEMAQGVLQMATSPLTAAIRKGVAEPVEDKTGIPAPVTEFVATMLLPTKKVPSAASLGKVAEAAERGYEAVRGSKAVFAPELTTALADHVVATLNQKGAYPHLAESVHKTIDLLRKDAPVGVDELRSVQEALSTLRVDPDSKVRRAANMASGEISQFLHRTEPAVAKTLETANANYAAAQRTKEIDQAAEIAGLRAGRAGYGGNSVNSMRQVLSPKVQSAIEGNPHGFNPKEIGAMRDIVEGTTVTNTLRGIGQLSPARGAVQTGIAIGTGGTSAVIGAVANKLASVLTSKQIDGLRELVLSRAPASARVANPLRDWYAASEKFGLEPTPRNFVRLNIAARNFASNLQSVGMSVDPDALLRAGAEPSPAESGQ